MKKVVLLSFVGLIAICNICKPMDPREDSMGGFGGLPQQEKDRRLIAFMHQIPLGEIEKLLRASANPNFIDKGGNTTALKDAVFWKRPKVVELLLKYGANPNLGLPLPLSFAIEFGRTTEAKILLDDPRIDVNAFDPKGNTALHEAARKNNLEITKLLLDKGANPLIVNLNKMRPNDVRYIEIIHKAAERKIAGFDVNYYYMRKKGGFDRPPLHKAAFDGNLEELNRILHEIKVETLYPNEIFVTDHFNLRVGDVVRLALKKIDAYEYDADSNVEREEQKKIRKEKLEEVRNRIDRLEEDAMKWAEAMEKRR